MSNFCTANRAAEILPGRTVVLFTVAPHKGFVLETSLDIMRLDCGQKSARVDLVRGMGYGVAARRSAPPSFAPGKIPPVTVTEWLRRPRGGVQLWSGTLVPWSETIPVGGMRGPDAARIEIRRTTLSVCVTAHEKTDVQASIGLRWHREDGQQLGQDTSVLRRPAVERAHRT